MKLLSNSTLSDIQRLLELRPHISKNWRHKTPKIHRTGVESAAMFGNAISYFISGFVLTWASCCTDVSNLRDEIKSVGSTYRLKPYCISAKTDCSCFKISFSSMTAKLCWSSDSGSCNGSHWKIAFLKKRTKFRLVRTSIGDTGHQWIPTGNLDCETRAEVDCSRNTLLRDFSTRRTCLPYVSLFPDRCNCRPRNSSRPTISPLLTATDSTDYACNFVCNKHMLIQNHVFGEHELYTSVTYLNIIHRVSVRTCAVCYCIAVHWRGIQFSRVRLSPLVDYCKWQPTTKDLVLVPSLSVEPYRRLVGRFHVNLLVWKQIHSIAAISRNQIRWKRRHVRIRFQSRTTSRKRWIIERIRKQYGRSTIIQLQSND